MKRTEFEKLKEGDIVVLNKMCRHNAGIKCNVTYVCRDVDIKCCCIWVKPIDGEREFSGDGICPEWNEISYKAANIFNED